MLGFYGKYLAGHLELMFSLKTHKKSAVEHSIEKPILFTTFCP